MNSEGCSYNLQYSDIHFPETLLDSYETGSYCSTTPETDFRNSCSLQRPLGTGQFRVTKRRGRPVANNAARERSRVKTLRTAFLDLQRTLPAVPPDTKLSKLDVLVLATTYIAHLMSALQSDGDVSQIFASNGCMHPVKK
ncbi:TCF24-like protein [Mya arenaria]|uniref:TCF24-like protein n=2 Tax=Mya arenaria TaxID=6604 RepID=A0ABY7FRR6_MYAAR|nr:TCF24-like protein [Mya arenaria]